MEFLSPGPSGVLSSAFGPNSFCLLVQMELVGGGGGGGVHGSLRFCGPNRVCLLDLVEFLSFIITRASVMEFLSVRP